MRAFRILGLAIGGLLALALLAVVAVFLFVDPNDHKQRIAAVVKETTGRELTLTGDLSLKFFPWIALETGEAALGNPPGFGTEPFLTLQRARLSVRLLPLLRRQLEVGRIELDGLDLRLAEDAGGKGNWEEWGSDDAEDPVGADDAPTVDLAGVSITNGRLTFGELVAGKLEVDIGRIAPGAAIPVAISTEIITAPGESALPVKLAGLLDLDIDAQRYRFADLALGGTVTPEGAPEAVAWELATPVADLDLAAQTLAQTDFTASVAGAALTGSIAGTQLLDAPSLAGRFQLAQAAPRALLARFGVELPEARDASVLAGFAAQGDYAWQDDEVRFTDLSLVLDESTFTGRYAFNLESAAMDFALTLDAIDLDRYQPPPSEPGTTDEPIELPVDFLRDLTARGTFDVGSMRIGGAQLEGLHAGVDVGGASAGFSPLRARLYGGTYSGSIDLDMREALPRLSLEQQMAGIDVAALMRDFADSDRLSGRGNLDMKLTARGRSGDALLKTLGGNVSVNLAGGAVEGIDVWYAITEAQSLVKSRQLAGATNTKRTAFETFRATAQLADGVAATNDLLVTSQLLRVTGGGTTSLVTQALDYSVTATVLSAPPGADEGIAELVRAAVPVKITGTLSDPKIRPDLAGLVRERVEQEIDRRKDEVIEKATEKVRDRLRGLLGGGD